MSYSKPKVVGACGICGEKTEVVPSQATKGRGQYCSRSCAAKGRSLKGFKKIIHCKVCGKEVRVQRYEENTRQYCSPKCHGEDRKSNGQGRVEVVCQICGEVLQLWPCYAKGRKYCSIKCSAEAAHQRMGEFNPSAHGEDRICHKNGREQFVYSGFGKDRQPQHRLVAGKSLGRKLKASEHVHHINGDQLDNRNQNLLICTNGYHKSLHERMSRLYMQEHFSEVQK